MRWRCVVPVNYLGTCRRAFISRNFNKWKEIEPFETNKIPRIQQVSNIAFAIVLKSLALPFNEVLREKREDAYERL